MQRVSARNVHGTIVFSGIDQRHASEHPSDRMITRRQDQQLRTTQQARQSTRITSNGDRRALDDPVVSEDDDDGPNDRGTYSKEYILRHPETVWIHRGQGRYLPESALDSLSNNASQSQNSMANDARGSRQSLRRRRVSTPSIDEDDDDSSSRRFRSPRASRAIDAPYSLRRRPSIHSQAESDTRESRALRRSNHAHAGGPHGVNEEDKTYSRSYVDAHPEQRFRHFGNGSYRRLLDISDTIDEYSHSADSSQSTNRQDPPFTRTRQRLDRRQSATSQTSTTSHATASGSVVDHSDGSNMESLTKQQMLDYQAKHPDVQFIHRGNGRYKKIDDVKTQVAQLALMDPEDKVTYSRDYVESHPEMEFHHCGYGRYKRGPKIVQPDNVVNGEDGQEIPDGLVTKDYVDAHPEYAFHHRGQGRYALGPRIKGIQNGTGSPSPSVGEFEATPKLYKDKLYDREYVDAHPNDTFHHRGQGRWARGPPPPGSSNKMAVRGPGIALTRTSTTSSAANVQYNEDDLPGLYDLVSRADGPDAFREVAWYYRGGGKWSRTTRAEQTAHETASRASKPKPMPGYSISPAMSREASTSRRGSQQSVAAAPTLKRKHSALQQTDNDTDNEATQRSTPSQRSRMLSLQEDYVLDADLPQIYHTQWPRPTEADRNDKVNDFMRRYYDYLAGPDEFVKLMTKHDIATRPTETLVKIAAHVQQAMKLMQDEYLSLDAITAPQARIPRKVSTGGRMPVDKMVFEDRKEADLYDYQFDPKRIGYQDPDTQKITRDAEGRELRKRRRRGDLDTEGVLEKPLPRRVIKPVNRFDGVPGSTSRKSRVVVSSRPESVTPDRAPTPRGHRAEEYIVPTVGRWAGHVPKRIKELRGSGLARGDAAAAADSADDEDMSYAHSDGAEM